MQGGTEACGRGAVGRSDRARFFALRHRLFRCGDRDWNGTAYNRVLAGPVLPEGGTPGRATTVSSDLDEPAPFAVADFGPPSPLRSSPNSPGISPHAGRAWRRTPDGLAGACCRGPFEKCLFHGQLLRLSTLRRTEPWLPNLLRKPCSGPPCAAASGTRGRLAICQPRFWGAQGPRGPVTVRETKNPLFVDFSRQPEVVIFVILTLEHDKTFVLSAKFVLCLQLHEPDVTG